MDDLISVIVPIYRVEKFLPKCIESIIAQTYQKLEILLIDDGSPDRCGEICEEYAKLDTRIRVIHQQNRGVSAARNAGLDSATGAYIGFVDADDWIEPSMYGRMHEWIKREDVQIAICGWILHDEYSDGVNAPKNNEHALLENHQALYYALRGDSFEGYAWNKLFDSKLFELNKCRFREDIFVCEDLLVTISCINMAKSVYYCSDPLYHYRAHAGAATRTLTDKSFSELTARQSIIELFVARDQKLFEMSKALYSAAATSLYARAALSSHTVWKKEMKPEAKRYSKFYLKSDQFPARNKFRFLLMLYFPVLSLGGWILLKRMFNLKWTPTNRNSVD